MKFLLFKLVHFFPIITSFLLSIITYFFFINIIIKKKSYKLNFLVLNPKRFNKDLQILNEDKDFQFFYINQSLIYYLLSPFVSFIKMDLKKNKWWEIQKIENYIKFEKKGSYFFENYLNFLSYLYHIDFIITPSHYYFQDRLFEIAISKTKIKYIVLNKENILDSLTLNNKIKNNLHKNIRFKGSYIITQNNMEKKCLEQSNICNAHKIISLGSPRFDKFYLKSKINNHLKDINNITLFSFRHSIGGYKLIDNSNTSGFSDLFNDGAQKYFQNVHSIIFKSAYNNKNTNYYIKTKFSGGWFERVNQIKKYYQNKFNDNLENVNITNSIDAQELISRSKLIIGINSSALIEARVMGRKVIIPIFDELSKKMKDYIYFKKYFDQEFEVIKNKLDFFNKIQTFINSDFNYYSLNDNSILKETFNFDKSSYKRYNYFFNKISS